MANDETTKIEETGSMTRLSDHINTSTRSLHAHLNRLIMHRLPLALPPHEQNPALYATGLLYVTPIYTAFETSWQSILQGAGSRTQSMLGRVRLPGLLRAQRLRTDLRLLMGKSEQEIEDLLLRSSKTEGLAPTLDRIKLSIHTKPHVVMAYTWVFYMALFAGGRHLRALIQESSKGWKDTGSLDLPDTLTKDRDTGTTLALNFFRFDGERDGEDLKADFKKEYGEAEVLLTLKEREDVIREAQEIFKFMIDIVDVLDSLSPHDAPQKQHKGSRSPQEEQSRAQDEKMHGVVELSSRRSDPIQRNLAEQIHLHLKTASVLVALLIASFSWWYYLR